MGTCRLTRRASKETKSWFGATPENEILETYSIYEAKEIDTCFVNEMIDQFGIEKVSKGVFVNLSRYEATTEYKIAFLLAHEYKGV